MIHALPGMGGDHRMFPDPWTNLPGFCTHDWPRHQGERTLSEVAARICEEHGVVDGDILIGASLGGMIACEITKIRKIDLIIPHPPHAHLLLEDAGHLISMTHAGRCVEFIEASQSHQATTVRPRHWA